ncbi:MAG: NfeD family protein, partial [Cytophagales bacterium]
DWFDFTFVPQQNIIAATLASLVGIGGFVLLFFVFGGQILKSKRMKKIALMETLETTKETSQGISLNDYVGKIGEAATSMRPSGKVKIEHKVFNAYSQGDFIEKGEKVKIIGAFGGNLSVEKAMDV